MAAQSLICYHIALCASVCVLWGKKLQVCLTAGVAELNAQTNREKGQTIYFSEARVHSFCTLEWTALKKPTFFLLFVSLVKVKREFNTQHTKSAVFCTELRNNAQKGTFQPVLNTFLHLWNLFFSIPFCNFISEKNKDKQTFVDLYICIYSLTFGPPESSPWGSLLS